MCFKIIFFLCTYLKKIIFKAILSLIFEIKNKVKELENYGDILEQIKSKHLFYTKMRNYR